MCHLNSVEKETGKVREVKAHEGALTSRNAHITEATMILPTAHVFLFPFLHVSR